MTEQKPNNRVAIVTGASSGIGEAAARRFAKGGFAVVLAARRKGLLDRVAGDITRDGGRALSVPTNLADATETSALVQQALEAFGRVDVLVNNAGYSPPYALEQLNRSQLRHVFDVNLLSGMQLIGELTPTMREQGGGRVVNVSSLTRYVGAPFVTAYSATKGGMEAMTASARIELAPWNIRLTVVVPGWVDTPIHDFEAGKEMREDPNNPYRELQDNLEQFARDQLESAIPSEDVAEVIWKAATVPNPKPHYFAPRSAKTAVRMFSVMPNKLAERILRGMYKWDLPRKPDD
ncbi:MAG: SDR family NAD(P)-dependent oxidoreductase [Myxococcales bacterium]|nr:MAG: SDR family NAD(P)-dependent oxidoreductase [Myxococcales bacterium]